MPYAEKPANETPNIKEMAPRIKHEFPPLTAELELTEHETKTTTKPLSIMASPNMPIRISTTSLTLP